jgi:hypothetical protein
VKDANLDVNVNSTQSLNSNVNSNQHLDVSANTTVPLNASFNVPQSFTVELATDQILNADFGFGGGECKVLYNTTAFWNDRPELKSKKGYLYIYSDWKKNAQEQNIAGIKVGDGNAYLIDLPFIEQIFADHIEDVIRHITQEEREFWNNKVRCYVAENNIELIFTTH